MTDDLRQKLNDYVDGLLSAHEAEAVEALLAQDAEAKAEVAFLQQLAQDASELPQTMVPKRDLWADVVDGKVLRQKLDDYVDGTLTDDEREAVEAMLVQDEAAKAEVAFLQQLAQNASELSKEMTPQRDLWTGVADAIDFQHKLNDYVDGALSDDEREAVEALLAHDDDAKADVAFLRQLAQDTAALPQSIAPKRDLWPEIADELVEKSALPWMRWARFAAAAVLLVAASSAVTVLYMKQTMDAPVVVAVNREAAAPVLTAFQASEQTYSTAIAQLTETLQQRRDTLAPETVAAIEANLKVIDDAIQSSRMALASDPNNQASVHTMLAMYKRKVDLLQQVVGLPHGG